MFRPRIRPKDICSDVDPTLMCSVRKKESRYGSFYWDARRGGYCSTLLPGPLGLPVLLDACPYCCERIPGAEARRNWEREQEKPKILPPYSGPPKNERGVNGGDATAYLDDGEDGG